MCWHYSAIIVGYLCVGIILLLLWVIGLFALFCYNCGLSVCLHYSVIIVGYLVFGLFCYYCGLSVCLHYSVVSCYPAVTHRLL